MNEKEIRKLYSALINKGYKLCDEESFVSNMNNKNNRKDLYDFVVSKGNFKIGDYENYEQRLTSSQVSPTHTTNPVEQAKSDTLRTDDEYFGDPEFSPEAMRNRMKKIENVAKETKSSLDNKSKELSEELDNLSLSSPIATGHTKDNGLQFNPSTGKLERTFSTPYGNTTTNKQIADLESYEYRTANNMTVSGRMRNANIRLEKLKAQAEERQRKVVEEWEQKQNEEYQEAQDKGFLGILQHSMRNTNNPSNTPRTWIEGDPEYRALQAAIHETEEEIATIKRESDRQDGKRVGFWRGFGEITGDIRTWDFGIGNLLDNGAKLSIDNELAEQYKSDGTRQAEQELLEATYLNQQAQQEYGVNDSFWFRAGTMTGHMPSFMLDFALTGGGFEGINILSKAASKGATKIIGKEVVEKMAKEGFKSYVKKNGVKGFAQETANWTIKALGTTADDLIIRAPLMTNTVAVAKTASDIADRKLGNVVINEDGTYDFSNDRTWSSAIWQGEANAVIENFSEMFGAHLDPIVTLGNMGKLANVIGAKRLGNILAKADAETLGGIMGKTNELFSKMGVGDYFGEVTEEYYGQLWRTMLNLDDAYIQNKDGKRTNLLATGQFHGDIWGGMALSMGLMSAGKYSLSATNYTMMKHDVNKADKRASKIFGDDVWEPLRHTLDLTTNENIGSIAEAVINDKNFTNEEVSAVLDYMEKSMYLRGLNLATMANSRNPEDNGNEQQANESYLDGYNTSTPQEMNDAKNMYEYQRVLMEELVDGNMLDRIDNDPLSTLHTINHNENWTREEKDIVLDYLNAKATYDGMIQRVRDDIDGKIEESNSLIDSHTNKGTGQIHGAVDRSGKLVYIVSGNVVTYEDGTGIDLNRSDESIIIRDAETGELQQVSPEFLSSLYDAQDPNEQKELNAQQIREQIAQEEGNKIDGTVDFNNKEQFLNDMANQIAITMILAERGFDKEYIKTFISRAQIVENPDGTLTFTDGQNEVAVPKQEIQQQIDANARQRAVDFNETVKQTRNAITQQDKNTPETTEYSVGDNVVLIDSEGNKIDGTISMIEDGTYIIDYNDNNGSWHTLDLTQQELDNMTVERNGVGIKQPVTEHELVTNNSTEEKVSAIGRSLSQDESNTLISEMESHAIAVPEIELTPDNWISQFGEDGMVSTPIGEVKMGENQIAKLFQKGRNTQFGMIKPTLENPDVIIEESSNSLNGSEERNTSLLFVKTFIGKDGKKVYFFKSVTVKKDGLEVSISSHLDRPKRIKEALEKGKLLYRFDGGAQTEHHPADVSVTASPENTQGGSEDKDNKTFDSNNNTEEKVSTTSPNLIPKDEHGNPIYEQADPATAWDALVEEAEGDEEIVTSVVQSMIADKEKELSKLEKAKVKDGTTPAEKTAAHKAHKIAVELARQEVEAWKNIANAPILRKQAEMAERQRIEDEQKARRKAEEERLMAERKEAERKEQELLNGIPDYSEDTPQNARARGYRRVNGHIEERQQPIETIQGKETEIEFSNDVRPKGHYAVIDASQLQPSHIQGNRNPLHFLDEAQPKERNDKASIVSAQKIAGNIRPATITTGETAYVGTPTVNTRGEVIQGNSRSDALKLMYENHQDQTQVYKQHLIDNAEQFGLNPEDVSNMENPVLVRMLDVNDEQAITLGQYVAQDTESGGIERIKPKNTVKKMGNDIGTYANLLLNGNNEDMSFAELLDNNGVEVLKWMAQKGYITPTQYDSQFDTKGNLTAEAKNDLRGIMYQSIFEGGNTRLEEMFNTLPAKAQKAILATAHRDFNSPNSERMMEEIQDSIRAFHALMQDEQFVKAKNFKDATMAVEAWQKQYQMDDVSGESYLPSEKFSNFALHLATMYKGKKQSNIQGVFNELYDLIQGAKEDNLFEQADKTPRTLVQAIKEVLNIDYNGQRRNNVLGGDNKTSQQGQHGRTGDVASRERTESGEQSANDSGRTDEDSGSSTFEIYRQTENESGDIRTAQTVHQSRSERKRPEQTPDGRRKTDGTGVADDATQEVLGTSNRGDIRVFEEGLDVERGGNTEHSERTRRTAESERLVSLAKQHGLFIPVEVIKTLTGKYPKRTGESVVYIDKEAGKVTKVKDPYAKSAMKSGVQPEDAAFEHLVHNLLFPETAYSLEGISEEMGDVRIVLTQNYIQNYDQPTREQIAEALAARGLFPEDNYSFGNELVSVTDVEGDNVLLGEDGTVYFIDPIIRFKKPLREILDNYNRNNNSTLGEQIKSAEKEVNTSPTDKQKEAGNYKKGHVQIGTFNVTIEQPKGSVRSGVDANGKKWETTMHNTYGYIRGTEGVDGDHIDVFLSNDIDGWNGNKIFVVDQYNEDGTFDEHKVMLGFNDIEEAESAYLDNYEKGWEKKHKIVVSPIHTEEFEKWINSSHRKTKAFAEYKSVKSEENRTKNNENRTKSTENSSKVEESSVKDESKNKTIVEQSKKPSSKIEDFGEKIGGARKDVIRKYADKINVNGTTFGSMFPKPDIDKLIEAGLPIDRVAALKAVYDNAKHEFERSKKHRGKERALRETVFYAVFAKGILSGNEDFELHHEGLVFTEVGVKLVKANIALYQAVFDRLGVEYIKTDLSAYAITPLTEETKKKLNLKSLNEHNGKMQESLAKRKGTEPPVYKDGDLINFIGEKYYNPKDQFETLEEAIDTMVERIGKEVKVGEEIKHTPILYWNVDALGRKDYSKIFIGIKVHGHGIVNLMEFKSSNEANSWIDEHDADFQQMAAAKIEQLKSDKSKPLPKYRIDNIYVRDNNGSIVRYDVYADFGKGIMRPLKSFDIPAKETSQERLRAQSEVYKNEVLPYMNSEEAKQSADEHARRIQQEKESKNRNYTTERKSRERVGRDWRNGKDATPDMFVDMDGNKSVFGFRAVEFGNYVTNKERQQFLNDIYDALMDMSDVLGVSPRALSLGGQLAIAVGARGKSSASGHYEPEKNVINLTKTSGYGILAHEWLHAFDRYFSNYNPSAIYVGGVQYATSEEYKDDMRQEVKDAFAALMDVIKKSDYYKRSMMLGEYWSSDKELAARALQDYIIRKLNERGQKNEFLSNLTATEDWDGEAENYPFPLGEESEHIGEAIDNLFSVIDEKVDKKGNTVMYQKGELVMDAESEAFRRATERTMKQLESIGIDVEIVSDEQTEAMLGNDVKFMSERRFSMLKKAASTINRWLSDNVRGKSFELHLPEHTRKLIKKAMGRDFDSHNITSNGIAHALKNHGETGTKLNERSIPIRKEDAELIPYIMTAPDRVEKAATDISGRESIRFYKELSNGYVVVVEKEYKNSPDDMETITMWAEKSSKATNAQQNAAPDTHVQNAILSTDVAKIQKDAETAILNDEKINFSRSAGIFYSNAKKAVLDIKQGKATPEQWLKMIEKNGGLKASEDRWLGLSDWLKTQQKRKNIDVQYAKEYDGEAKQIAHGIKEGDISSIDLAAIEMVKLVKDGDILIPIPSRTGKATTSLALANRIAELAGKGKVADVLTGKERESLYNIKKEGKELPKASELEFVLKNQDVLNGNNRVVFVDNVMGTGTTLEAAVEFIPNATALVYAKDNSTLSDKKTLTKDEILNFINENSIQIEEVEYEENPSSFDELKDEYERLLREEGYDYAQEVMRDRYGDNFDIAFADMGGELVIDNEEAAATLLGSNNIINSTRLQYTTEGLDNKKEIALVVPTVEPYNSHDNIHFGDAGNGRAVAWVRFGETTDKGGKRVLVIDEIQSKRHQDGREKGYGIDKKRGDFLKARQEQIVSGLKELGVTTEVFENDTYRFVDDTDGEQFGTFTKIIPNDERGELIGQYARIDEELWELKRNSIPSAPFEKNWHELAMKRMLRYAAENGFDKVAWTTGEQQAERYSMTKFFNNIEREDNPYIEGRRFILYGGNHESLHVNEDGMIIESTIEETINKPLGNIVGKDIAVKMMSLEDGDMLENEELSIGGEGMKGFYDNMLPAFVNKYGKKWGAKVGEVSLPKIGDNGLTMHSVDVTPQMKEDVMKGQPMFHKGQMSFDFLNQQDTPLSDTRLRKLEEGETSKIERIFTENKNFDFTSGEKIESIDDVAFIFKQLEDESIENSFAVLVKDGKPTIIHLGMGSYTATGLNGSALNVAVERIQPDKIYFIHNHPSGNLTASRQDIELLNRLKSTYGDIFEDGIIINLRSGKFATFNAEEKNIHDEKNIDNAVPIKVYSFNKQVFEKNYDPAETFKIRSSSDVAKFISSHRLGERPKLGILVCNNQLGVVGNVFTPYTKVTKENAKDIAKDIVYYTTSMGGTCAMMFGNANIYEVGSKRISQHVEDISTGSIKLMDYLNMQKDGSYWSASNEGVSFMRTSSGKIYGWTVDGKVYLTKDGINPNTPVHEYSHLWAEALMKNNPVLWSRIVNGIKDTPVWNEVMLDEEYSSIHHNYNLVASEVLSRLSGTENYRRTMEEAQREIESEKGIFAKAEKITIWERVKQALKDFWNWVVKTYGTNNITPEEAVNMTLNDFWNGVKPKGARSVESATDISNTEEEDEVLYRYEDTKDKIEELFYQSISGNLKGKTIPIGRLTNNGKVYLEQISGISFKENVDFVLNPSDLIHIYKGHFGNNETDERSIPLDIEDIRSIVDVISFPDKIIYTKEVSGERRKMFFFLKEAENGTYNLLEIYADKKGNLTAKTFYKTKEGVSQRAMTLSKSLHTTSKTDGATLSSANIPQMFESSTFESENLRNNNNESSSSPTRVQRRQMIEHVENLAKKLHLDNIEIVNSVSGLEGKKKGAKGFFSKKSGKITIVVPNHTSIADIEKTLLHEAVAHYGLRKLFGKHFDTFLDNVYNNVEESIRKHIAELAINKYNYDFRKATEEYLASLAERTNFENVQQSNWWQKIRDFFADMLSKLGFKDFRGVTLTDNELRYILWRSYENLSSNKHDGIFGEAADIAKQYELGVGDYAKSSENEDDVLFRDGDNTYQDKATVRKIYEDRMNNGLYQSKEAMLDSMKSLEEAMLMIDGKNKHVEDIADYENAYLGENRLSSVNSDEITVFEKKFIRPMLKVAAKLAKNMQEYIELLNYMMAKHGLERNVRMADDKAKKEIIKRINILKNEIFKESKRIEKSNELYNKKLEEFRNKTVKGDIKLGKPGPILESCGINASDIFITPKTLSEHLNKHGLTTKDIADLPKALEDPMLVYEWGTKAKSLVVITQIERGNQRITVAIKLERGGKRLEINEIASIHGKEAEYFIEEMSNAKEGGLKDALKYANKENALDWLGLVPPEGTASLNKQGLSIANVIQNFENPITRIQKIQQRIDITNSMYRGVKNSLSTEEAKRWYNTRKQTIDSLLKNEKITQEQYDKRLQKIESIYNTGMVGIERNRDFAGLTALTGKKNVADAEAEAQRMVDEYEQNHDTAELWDKVNAVSKAILQKSYDSGLMNKETFDRISSMYKFYIPLRGFDEKTSAEAYAYLTHKESAFNAPIKQACGRTSKADNPLVYLQSMAESTIMQGNRNRLVKQRFLNFVLNHPSDLVSVSELWLEYDNVDDEWRPVFPDNIDTNDSGEVVEQKMKDFEEKMESLAKQHPDKYKKSSDAKNIPYRVVTSKDLHEHQIVVKRNGRDVILTVNGNPRLAHAINGLSNPDNNVNGTLHYALEMVGSVNRFKSALYTTWSVGFMAGNFMRDCIYSNSMVWVKEDLKGKNKYYALKYNYNYLKLFGRMKRLLRKYNKGTLDMSNPTHKHFYDFMRNGGETGYSQMNDLGVLREKTEQFIKAVNALGALNGKGRDLAEWLGEVGRGIENHARFAAFMTSRDMGRDMGRSIYDAKDISVNFNKKGSGDKYLGETGQTTLGNVSAATSFLGRTFFYFWNAALQGTFGNFFKHAARHPYKALTVSSIWFTLGLLVTALAASDDDDDESANYFNNSEHTRRSNVMIKSGKNFLKVPLPIEYRAIYGLGELCGSTIFNGEELTVHKVLSLTSQLLPVDFMAGQVEGDFNLIQAFVPSSIKTHFELKNNRSWSGIPIYKDTPFNQDKPDYTKAYSNANKHIVNITKNLNEKTGGDAHTKGIIDMNPAKAEYWLQANLGGIWTLADQLIKTGEWALGKRDFRWNYIPVAERFVTTPDERTAYRYVNNEYFRLKKEHDQLHTRIKAYEKDTYNGIFDYAEKIDFLYNSPEYKRYEIYEKYKDVIKIADELVKQAAAENDEEAFKEAEHYLNELKKEMIEEMNKTRKRKRA